MGILCYLYLLQLVSLASCRNACGDFSDQTWLSNHNTGQHSYRPMTRIHTPHLEGVIWLDLMKTRTFTTVTIERIENHLANEAHLQYLHTKERSITIPEVPFTSEDRHLMYLLYRGIHECSQLINHLKNEIRSLKVTSFPFQRFKRTLVYSITAIEQGVGTEGGLYQMLCLIYRNYPEVVALYDFKTPYTIPEEYYTDGTPGRAIDAAYLLLSQVLKSMNLLDRELLFYIHKDERR